MKTQDPKPMGYSKDSSKREVYSNTILLLYTILLLSFSHSVVSNSETPWTAACQASLSIIISQSLLKPIFIESVMPFNYLNLCHPLPLLPSIFPSIRVFSNESVLHIRWPKYWSFSSSISPSNEYSGLISFMIDWFDLLAVQGTLKSLQHHSSKASILWCSAFFMVQLSHPINDYWKNHSFDYMDLCQQSNVSAFNTILTSGYKENFK